MTRRYVTIKEMVESGCYYKVTFKHGRHNVTSESTINYQTAIWYYLADFSFLENLEQTMEIISKEKFVMKRLNDEEILDNIWNKGFHSLYIRHWLPSMNASELVEKLKNADPDIFLHNAYVRVLETKE